MQVLENIWYLVAHSAEITTTPMRRIICGLPLVIFRSESGQVAAMEDRCPHRQAQLSMGKVLGENIQCNYHGLIFNPVGECIHIPRQDTIPARNQIRAFVAVEQSGFIWLWWGDRETADNGTIPALPWIDDEDRRSVFFHWHVNANFQLMADNLLDVSHVDFLHRGSIASNIDRTDKEALVPNVTIETTVDGDEVHNLRRVENTYLAGMAADWVGTEGPVNRLSTGHWVPPNSCLLKLEFESDDHDLYQCINLDHIMTPETETTCHYFMDWTRNFGLHGDYPTDEDVDREQRSLVEIEDIPMVEGQQHNIDEFGHMNDLPVKQDKFVNEVHRILQRLYAEAGITSRTEVTRLAAE